VWGNFNTFVTDFVEIIQTGNSANSTNATGKSFFSHVSVLAENSTQVADNAIRREVVHEVRSLEEDAREVFNASDTPAVPVDPITKEVAEDEAEPKLQQSESSDGIGVLEKISFTDTPDSFLARLDTSEKIGRVTYFWMEKPLRLVVDLRGSWKNNVLSVYPFTDSFMHRVVIGMHPERLRLVFRFTDTDGPMGGKPELIHTPDGMDIVVTKPVE